MYFTVFILLLQPVLNQDYNKPTKAMAKVGYIYQTPHDDTLDEVREWMRQYGLYVELCRHLTDDHWPHSVKTLN